MHLDTSMENPKAARPLSATLIAWFWILQGVGVTFGAVDGYVTTLGLRRIRPSLGNQPSVEPVREAIESLAGFSELELVGGLAVSVALVVASVGLLKLRRWGRWSLLALSWLSVLLIPAGILIWTAGLTGFIDRTTDERAAGGGLIWFIAIAQCIISLAVFGLMMRCLHGRRIREAIEERHHEALD